MAVSDRIAVMNQGSVVQVGTAEDLYHRPVNEFVATFVGRVNLVPGTVVDAAPGGVTVAALGTTLRVRAPRAGFACGAPVKVVVRPEAVGIVEPAGAALTAVVSARTFLGEKVEYVLQCAGSALQAVRYGDGPAVARAEGATVGVALAEDALAVLPVESP